MTRHKPEVFGHTSDTNSKLFLHNWFALLLQKQWETWYKKKYFIHVKLKN